MRKLLIALVFILLSACTPSTVPVTKVVIPSPTSKPTPTSSLTRFIPQYNKTSIPILPPDYSVSGWIWSDRIPATPINSKPQVVNFSEPKMVAVEIALLENAGCSLKENGYTLECSKDSPLLEFGCSRLTTKPNILFGLEPSNPIIAKCSYELNSENTNDEYLYREGCLLRHNVGYIFWIDNEYILINNSTEMKDNFAPITSVDEALGYAQILTGLEPIFRFDLDNFKLEEFEEDWERVYFQEIIEGTHVTETDNGYVVPLFHSTRCGCNAFITSEVNISVNRVGEITWENAMPIYVDILPLCAD